MERIGVPIKERNLIINGVTTIEQYIEKKSYGKYKNVKIINKKILKNQLIYKAGNPYYMVSSGEIKMCKQLLLNKQEQLLLFIAINNGRVKPKLILKAYEHLCKGNNEECLKDNYIKMKKYLNEDKMDIKEKNKDDYIKSKQYIYDWVINQSIISIYTILIDKIQSEYSERIGESLRKCKEKILMLTVEEKIELIKSILDLISGSTANFSLLGGAKDVGRITKINMNEKWLKDVKFVNQSVTGIYEKKVGINELENYNSIK